MPEEEVRLQATRVARRLRESWSEELADAEFESNAMGGLALAEAVVRGWIEPDPSLVPFLATAEEALDSVNAYAQGEGGDDDDE